MKTTTTRRAPPRHPAFRWSAAALLPLALAACTLEPTYERPVSPVPNAWPSGDAYRSGDGKTTSGEGQPADNRAAQPEVSAANLGWQDFFTDARLRKLIELGLANNRDLRVATLSIEQARAQYRI